jgi:diaminopimelate decarboxylase
MIESYKLKSLSEEYGTPLFVLDESVLEARVRQFVDSFIGVWPATKVCYSVKTNYVTWIVRKMCGMGLLPEVISGFELDLISEIRPTGEVVVNGPVKTEAELALCLQNDYLINVDNLDELKTLAELAVRMRKVGRIGLRVRPHGEAWKRFGFEFESGNWCEALSVIKRSPQISLIGLHTHIGTGIIDLQRYESSSRFMLKVASSLPGDLSYLDMGGGFATRTARLSHYADEDWRVPSDEAYADSIIRPLKPYLHGKRCQLFVEPGRALIDDAVSLLCSVISVDNDRIIVDAGKNIVPSVLSRLHPVVPIEPTSSEERRYDIFGPLCMGSDCLGHQVILPTPRVSDVLKLVSVGAYCQSQSMQFIKYQPPVVVVSAGGAHQLVRRRQTLADLLAQDL